MRQRELIPSPVFRDPPLYRRLYGWVLLLPEERKVLAHGLTGITPWDMFQSRLRRFGYARGVCMRLTRYPRPDARAARAATLINAALHAQAMWMKFRTKVRDRIRRPR